MAPPLSSVVVAVPLVLLCALGLVVCQPGATYPDPRVQTTGPVGMMYVKKTPLATNPLPQANQNQRVVAKKTVARPGNVRATGKVTGPVTGKVTGPVTGKVRGPVGLPVQPSPSVLPARKGHHLKGGHHAKGGHHNKQRGTPTVTVAKPGVTVTKPNVVLPTVKLPAAGGKLGDGFWSVKGTDFIDAAGNVVSVALVSL